jgi:hypothetical protein
MGANQGANYVGFVLGVDGAQYFVHELIGSWDGMSLPETFVSLYSADRGNPRSSLSLRCMRVFIRWRTNDVRVSVCLSLDAA